MFEAKIQKGSLLKKIVEALRELVTDANIDCTPEGINMQAMDSSHVSLVSLTLRNDGFLEFRCDRNLSLGLSLINLGKILKCAANNDVVTLRSEDQPDVLSLQFEGQDQDRLSDFEMKLMSLDTEHLGIPETDYKCQVKMPSAEFARIIRDLSAIGDTCTISCTKEGVAFKVEGDLGSGSIMVRNTGTVEKEEDAVVVTIEEPVELSFALRYLNMFIKATPLAAVVILSMSPEVPIVVEYPIDQTGHIQYFLAPKIDEDEE